MTEKKDTMKEDIKGLADEVKSLLQDPNAWMMYAIVAVLIAVQVIMPTMVDIWFDIAAVVMVFLAARRGGSKS